MMRRRGSDNRQHGLVPLRFTAPLQWHRMQKSANCRGAVKRSGTSPCNCSYRFILLRAAQIGLANEIIGQEIRGCVAQDDFARL